MKAEMEKRIEADSSYRLFSHSGQEAFINDYYELLPLENDNQSFLFDFGQLLRSFGRYSDSNAILQKGTMVSNDPMFYVLIGNNYKDMKCYDLSEMAYQKAYSIMPNRLYPLYQLMLLYETEGKAEKMSEMAQRVLSFKEKVVSPATKEMKMKAREMIDSIESRMMKHINGYNEH
jgi:tetratricopeptide (TPR) repeat protein